MADETCRVIKCDGRALYTPVLLCRTHPGQDPPAYLELPLPTCYGCTCRITREDLVPPPQDWARVQALFLQHDLDPPERSLTELAWQLWSPPA